MERGGFYGYQRLPISSSFFELSNNHQSSIEAHTQSRALSMAREHVQLFMPIANVIRIMRKVLPTEAKISDEAKESIQECVLKFIWVITCVANERCHNEQRRIVSSQDVVYAMNKLGFKDYIQPLTLFLRRYRYFEGERASMAREPMVKRALEPLVKRALELAPFSIAASSSSYVPAFHHHREMYGRPVQSGYFVDGSVQNPAQATAVRGIGFVDPHPPPYFGWVDDNPGP